MHIRLKFDGGKHINCIQSGSWQDCCAGARLRQNLGLLWGLSTWERVTGNQPNDTYQKVAKPKKRQAQEDREQKATHKAKEARRLSKIKATDNSLQSHQDYSRYDDGPNADDISTDVPPLYLQDMMVNYYNTHVAVSQAQISEGECLTRQPGRDNNSSNLWLARTCKRIISSNVGWIAKWCSSTKVANTAK